jgi:hypothetical protein
MQAACKSGVLFGTQLSFGAFCWFIIRHRERQPTNGTPTDHHACPIFIPKQEPRKEQHATGSFFIQAIVESIITRFATPLLLRETQASEAIKQRDGTLIVSGKLLALLVNSQRASWPSACPQVVFDHHFIRWMTKILSSLF